MDVESFRKSRDWTQERLAAALGVESKGYISSLENGSKPWPMELALKMQLVSDGAVPARSLLPKDKRDLLDQVIAQAPAAAGA